MNGSSIEICCWLYVLFFFSCRRRHTRCALVTGVQTCALPIFREALPHADIYVYDNNSGDRTREIAEAAGAVVRTERMQGKGYVVRRMFADVDADVYVMADGDATYDASAAPLMVRRLLEDQLDMVVGASASEIDAAYRRGHRLGKVMLTGILARMFGRSFSDILSG